VGQLCLNGGGCGIRFRARDNIGAPGFHFDAAVTSSTTGVQFLIGMDNKQKEAEAKENDHSRCRDKAERDEGEQGCDIGLRCPGPLSRGIGERNRRFGRLWTRVSTRTSRPELSRQLVEQPLSEHSAAFPLTHPRIQAATGDRKAPALVMNYELPISVLAGGHPARPFAAIEPTYGKSTIRV
jgi:hypothetical protein